ncbi:EAL domain-containing protein [Lacticaseibacillus thailandensis]|uniref:EAL domain-containing protein n=1 Tax=Lacticaseibacillus thailandensis TaxID=381741 RepID=UPI0006D1BE66|nr:EAL domain-containing protein [Lacticaseibacillus thailandensis]
MPIGYELFIRKRQGNEWVLPQDFNAITVDTIGDLLGNIVDTMSSSIRLLSFNLEEQQFIDPAFMEMVARIQARTKINLFTELTERRDPGVNFDQIQAAAQRFHDNNLLVCIDDVGVGQNNEQLIAGMEDSVAEFKFACQDLRPCKTFPEIEPLLASWYNEVQRQHKAFAVEGIETQSEMNIVTTKYPCDVVQGYWLGRPRLLGTQIDVN